MMVALLLGIFTLGVGVGALALYYLAFSPDTPGAGPSRFNTYRDGYHEGHHDGAVGIWRGGPLR